MLLASAVSNISLTLSDILLIKCIKYSGFLVVLSASNCSSSVGKSIHLIFAGFSSIALFATLSVGFLINWNTSLSPSTAANWTSSEGLQYIESLLDLSLLLLT